MNIKTGIPKDKLIHFIVGFMLSPWFILDAPFSLNMGWVGWLAIFGLAFLLKEVVWDKVLKKGNFELMDAAWTMAVPTLVLITDTALRL